MTAKLSTLVVGTLQVCPKSARDIFVEVKKIQPSLAVRGFKSFVWDLKQVVPVKAVILAKGSPAMYVLKEGFK